MSESGVLVMYLVSYLYNHMKLCGIFVHLIHSILSDISPHLFLHDPVER